MAKISLCVIARDEEELLPGLLQSVAGVVDQVVVVDTGSVDSTVEVARSFGAQVVSDPWQNDFSKARNVALEYAEGDYVLILDADERLAPGAGKALRDAVEIGEVDFGLLPLINAVDVDETIEEVIAQAEVGREALLLPRLFRRMEGLCWEGEIHEMVPPDLMVGRNTSVLPGVRIVHYGAVESLRQARGKDVRNLQLLKSRCEREPANPVMGAYLVRELIRAGELDAAWEQAESSWSAFSKVVGTARVRPTVVALASLRAHLLLAQGRNNCALDCLDRARAWGADHPNVDLMSGAAAEMIALETGGDQSGHWLSRSAAYYDACLERHGVLFAEELFPGATSWAAQTRLGTVRMLQGAFQEALELFDASLSAKPDHYEAVLGRAEALLGLGMPEASLQVVEPCLETQMADGWVIAAAACDALGRVDELVLLAYRARELAPDGFVAIHRRTCLEQLELACCIYGGQPVAGPGPVGLVASVMAGVPEGDNFWAGQDPDRALITRIALNTILSGHSVLLDRLFEPRSEQLMPGIGRMLSTALAEFDINVQEDGEPSYVFIGGAGRSGTTLLRVMLDAHKDIYCGPELKLVVEICKMHQDWSSLMSEVEGSSGEPQAALDAGTRAFIGAALQEMAGGAECIAEKTPHNLLAMELLGRLFPRARFIHVVRDGRAVSASLVKQQWSSAETQQPISYCQDLPSAATYWRQVVSAIRQQSQAVSDRYMEVHYEDLVTEPNRVMRQVLAFLGQSWDEQVLTHQQSDMNLGERESSSDAVREAVHTRALTRWRNELSDSDVAQIEQVASDALTAMGYELVHRVKQVG
ncbi:MAG: sulfotransferase [Myxococcota bacterium]|nr:sulfotransferase [Myxococcota bacterium]